MVYVHSLSVHVSSCLLCQGDISRSVGTPLRWGCGVCTLDNNLEQPMVMSVDLEEMHGNICTNASDLALHL